jgi:hypothetical protein
MFPAFPLDGGRVLQRTDLGCDRRSVARHPHLEPYRHGVFGLFLMLTGALAVFGGRASAASGRS